MRMMNTTAIPIVVALGLAGLAACVDRTATEGTEADSSVAAAPAGHVEKVTLTVPNMACPLCANSIEQTLRRAGLSAIEIDLETKTVVARFEPERMTPDQVKKLVTGLGYEVSDLKVG